MHASEAKSGARQDVPRRGGWKSSGPDGPQARAEALGGAATWRVFPRNAQHLSFVLTPVV